MQNLCTNWSDSKVLCRLGLEEHGTVIASCIYSNIQPRSSWLLRVWLCSAIDVPLFSYFGEEDESDFLLILLCGRCCQWWIKRVAKLISHEAFGLGPLSCLSLLCMRVWQICQPGDRVTAPQGCSETQSGSDTTQPVRPSVGRSTRKGNWPRPIIPGWAPKTQSTWPSCAGAYNLQIWETVALKFYSGGKH